jgi:hypothetical protein
VVDDVVYGVETLFDGKVVLVVDRAEEVGGFASGDEVGSSREADGERMKLGPRGESSLNVAWRGKKT